MTPRLLKFEQVPLPIFKELKSKEYIYYGEKNDYPNYLLRLYNNSAKHNAIITGKVDYTCGNGWEVKGDSLIDKAKAYTIIDEVNLDHESLNEITQKIATDLFLFGGFYLQIIWTNGTGEIAELYHIDYTNVRTNEDNSLFFVSKEWIKNGNTNSRPEYETFPAFDENNRSGTQILYYKEYRAGLNTYSLPDYRGSINYIELDICIGEYHLNSINNGMFSSKLINFPNGIVSEEEEARIEKLINKKFAGSKNAGKFMLSFTDGVEKKPEVIDLSGTELDKHFDLLNKTVQQEIYAGAKITSPMLFGIRVEGQLGGRTEMLDAAELFQNTYISSKQKAIEGIINYLYSFNDISSYLCLNKVEPMQMTFTEAVITANMTQDEIRNKLSLPDIQKIETNVNQELINTINSLPVALQTKVIENLSADEIRSMVGLVNNNVVPTEQMPIQQPTENTMLFSEDCINAECNHIKEKFSIKDDDIIKHFEGKGVPKKDYVVLSSNKMMFDDDLEKEMFKELNLNNIQQIIVEQIKSNPYITKTEIANIARVPLVVVDNHMKALVDAGAITESKKKIGKVDQIKRDVTKIAEKYLKKNPPLSQMQILYSYEERPKVPKAKSGSRPLCEKLYGDQLFFTRKEIEDITNQLGYSVFTLCGGWYTNPKTKVTTPYCRHFWQRNVVVKKK